MSRELEKLKDNVIATVTGSKVTIVVGATGTGKSTFVPFWLANEDGRSGKIICIQPRRVAVVSLARRVAGLFGEADVGGTVGYRMRGGVLESSETRLVYATGGYFRAMMSRDPACLGGVSHIVLDEVHERSMDSDFVSLLVKLLMQAPSKYPKLKLVVMSATINTELFSEYFATVCGEGESVSIVEIPASSPHAIETMYLEELARGGDRLAQCARILVADISSGSAPEVREAHVELISAICLERATAGFTTLVFLPGEAAIEMVEKKLMEEIPRAYLLSSEDEPGTAETSYYQLHVLHSLVPIEDQNRALRKPGARGKHIVLATNIAESSLTVEGVNLVIDTGMKRESLFDPARKLHALRTNWASRASGMQRRGRTGRVCPGLVLKLFTSEMENSVMRDFEVPEAVLADPALLFLNAKHICEHWRSHRAGELIAQLISFSDKTFSSSSFSCEKVVNELFNADVLVSDNQEAPLTLFGSLATWLQLDVSVSKLVYLSLVMGLPAEGIVLAAAASMEKEVFKFTAKFQAGKEARFFDRVKESMKHRIAYDMGFCSDLIMLRNLLVSWLVLRARPTTASPELCAASFVTGGVFLSEFETFRAACSTIARSVSDWLDSSGRIGGIIKEEKVEVSSSQRAQAIFQALELQPAVEMHAFFGKEAAASVAFFSDILNHRKRSVFTQAQLSPNLFLPLFNYAEADLLKLLITLAFADPSRVLTANASFARSEGEVFSVKMPSQDPIEMNEIVEKLTGFDPLEIRRLEKGQSVSLVLAHYDAHEPSLPHMSEFASVTASVAIRSLLSVFEKSWKTEIALKDNTFLKIQKPYVFNILRWQLPGDDLGSPDTRVYLSPRNPSGWLETASGMQSVRDPNSSMQDRNSDGRRRTLASQFFAVPVRLSTGGADLAGVLRAHAVTVLPVRCGGRVANTLLLCAVPLDARKSSVRNLFSLDRFGQETLNLVPGKPVSINPAFPIWEDMIGLIDDVRAHLHAVMTLQKTQLAELPLLSTNIGTNVHTLLDLANADELNLPETLPQTAPAPDSKKHNASMDETAHLNLDSIRLRALEAEIDVCFKLKQRENSPLVHLWGLVNAVWDIYESRG